MSYDTKASFVLSFVFDAGDKLASLRGETFELESFGLRPKVCHFCQETTNFRGLNRLNFSNFRGHGRLTRQDMFD